jgi:hypothetical protein
MNHRRRLAAGAAIAGVLVTPPAALAGVSPNPAEASDGSAPVGPVTTVPLPDAVAQCLTRNGLPVLSATTTTVDLPAMAGAPPAGFTGTIPLSGTGVPTTGGTIPLSGVGAPATATGTNPLPTGDLPATATGTNPLPVGDLPATATGTNPLPAGGGPSSTGALECGQLIINNLIYVVLVPLTNNITTNTTTTTTANGPMTAANGPVTITDNAPAAAPVTTTDNAPAPVPVTPTPVRVATGKGKQKDKPRRHRRKRSTVRKHAANNRAGRAVHIVLVRKSPGGSRRVVTALAGHAGRGS